MATVKRDDVNIFYRDQGEGPPVLLLHGHTLDHRVFEGLASAIEARAMRVIRPDLRGHGRSTRPPQGYHWSDHCGDVEAVLDAAGIDRAAVVGFSLGGGIALEMALERPDRVGKLVLMSPVMPDRPFDPEFMANLKAVAAVARTEGIRAAMEGPWMKSPLFAASLAKPGVLETLSEIVKDFPGAEYLAEARDRVERDWTVPDRLGEITADTLVLVGEREMPGFMAFAQDAAEGIPGARLEIIPDSGHLLPLEAADQVATAILDHLG